MARPRQNSDVIILSKIPPKDREKALAQKFKNGTGDWPSDRVMADMKKACLPRESKKK